MLELKLELEETHFRPETEQDELDRLRRENDNLKLENELLRRFAAMLADK